LLADRLILCNAVEAFAKLDEWECLPAKIDGKETKFANIEKSKRSFAFVRKCTEKSYQAKLMVRGGFIRDLLLGKPPKDLDFEILCSEDELDNLRVQLKQEYADKCDTVVQDKKLNSRHLGVGYDSDTDESMLDFAIPDVGAESVIRAHNAPVRIAGKSDRAPIGWYGRHILGYLSPYLFLLSFIFRRLGDFTCNSLVWDFENKVLLDQSGLGVTDAIHKRKPADAHVSRLSTDARLHSVGLRIPYEPEDWEEWARERDHDSIYRYFKFRARDFHGDPVCRRFIVEWLEKLRFGARFHARVLKKLGLSHAKVPNTNPPRTLGTELYVPGTKPSASSVSLQFVEDVTAICQNDQAKRTKVLDFLEVVLEDVYEETKATLDRLACFEKVAGLFPHFRAIMTFSDESQTAHTKLRLAYERTKDDKAHDVESVGLGGTFMVPSTHMTVGARWCRRVFLSTGVKQLKRFNESDDSFYLDIIVTSQWETDASEFGSNAEDRWQPKVQVTNSASDMRQNVIRDAPPTKAGNTHQQHARYTGTLFNTQALSESAAGPSTTSSFPYDTKVLVCVLHLNQDIHEGNFVQNLQRSNTIDSRFDFPGWRFLLWNPVLEFGITDPSISTSGTVYSVVGIKLLLQRLYEPYEWKVFLPFFIVTQLSLCTLALEDTSVAVVSNFAALIAYNQLMTTELSAHSRSIGGTITCADQFRLTMLLFIALQTMWQCMRARNDTQGIPETIVCACFLCVFFAYQFYFVCSAHFHCIDCGAFAPSEETRQQTTAGMKVHDGVLATAPILNTKNKAVAKLCEERSAISYAHFLMQHKPLCICLAVSALNIVAFACSDDWGR
jgi:hypothetical protein